jgi:hypothetical protein
MLPVWRRIREVWRRSGERRDENVVENALYSHEVAEREKHTETTPLPPGRTNTDWTYIGPP